MFATSHPRIRSEEWNWLLVCSIVIIFLISLPYLYGSMLSTSTHQFGGFVIGVEDGNSYLAKMREGQVGYWLFYLAYTPEAHQGALFFLFYILLGKLANLFNLEPLLLLQWSRLLTVGFGLVSFYIFVACFTANIFIRRLALLLFGVTAGFGWLWLLLGFSIELGQMPVDLWVPDTSFFLSAFTFPHLSLAQGLILWVVITTFHFFETNSLRSWLAAAGAGFLVSLVHPYTLAILGAVFGAHLLWQSYHQKKILWQAGGRLALVILPSLPYLSYVFIVFETNFAFNNWREQNLTWSPHPIHYILGFGLILPLAGLGLWQHRLFFTSQNFSFLTFWIFLVPLFLYAPTPLQRRFVDGYQAALAVPAAAGLAWLVWKLKLKRLQFFTLTGVFFLMVLTNLFLLVGAIFTIQRQEPPVFYPISQQAAFHWLAEKAPGQVVMAAYETGNILPAYAPMRVFAGHGSETVRSAEKRALLAEFFAPENDHLRRRLIKDYAIIYLFYGPRERELGAFSPTEADYLRQVYDNGTVQIFEVVELN